jgi:hypothetical protein
MNVKRAATIVTTGGGLAAWLVGATTSNHVVAPSPEMTRPPIERRGAELATEIAKFHEHLPPTAAPRQPGRNLFKFRAAPVAHAPAASAQPAPLPDGPAPAPVLPPMRLIGISEDPGSNGPDRKAMITGDGRLFIAKEGDTVMTRYKVTRISADVGEHADIEDGTVRRLALR